jgi:hypothetical protein
MKNVFALLAISMLAACASHYKTLYSADTAGTSKCSPVVVKEGWIDLKENDVKKFEEKTGYSECSFAEKTEATLIVNCKRPGKYSSITTYNMASCHQFMADNNFQVVR